MYDPTPGNYWFGKKWYYIKTNPTPKCPDRLTENNARFINQDQQIDPGLTITCLDDQDRNDDKDDDSKKAKDEL